MVLRNHELNGTLRTMKKLIELFDSYEKAEADCKEADRYRDDVLRQIQELTSQDEYSESISRMLKLIGFDEKDGAPKPELDSNPKPEPKKSAAKEDSQSRPLSPMLNKKDVVALRALECTMTSSVKMLAKDLLMHMSTLKNRLKRLEGRGYAKKDATRGWRRTREGEDFLEKHDELMLPNPTEDEEIAVLKRLKTDKVMTLTSLGEKFKVDNSVMRKRLLSLRARLAVAQDVSLGWYKTTMGAVLEKELSRRGRTPTDAQAAE